MKNPYLQRTDHPLTKPWDSDSPPLRLTEWHASGRRGSSGRRRISGRTTISAFKELVVPAEIRLRPEFPNCLLDRGLRLKFVKPVDDHARFRSGWRLFAPH